MSDLGDIEIQRAEPQQQSNYQPQTTYNDQLTPEQRAKKSALAAKTKRWMLKRKGREFEEDHRTPQEMAIDNLAIICDENGWDYTFDEESLVLLVRKDNLAFKANLEPGGSGIEECFFMRQCAAWESLQAAIEAGFEFERPQESPSEPRDEDEVEDQYERVVELAILNVWDIQGDGDDPDKLALGRGQELVTVRWGEDGTLKASIGYRISSLMTLFNLVRQYSAGGDKSTIN